MAEALKVFVKAFCKRFTHVQEWEVLSSYDRTVKSKYQPSRVYKKAPHVERRDAEMSFAHVAEFDSFADLVTVRTVLLSPVAKALGADAYEVSERLVQEGRVFDGVDLWGELKSGFVLDREFRKAFSAALAADGLDEDVDGFWRTVDDRAATLNGLPGDSDDAMMEASGAVIGACVYASLCGARELRQYVGLAPEETPSVQEAAQVGMLKQQAPTRAQLVLIVFTGPELDQYCVQVDENGQGPAQTATWQLNQDTGARMGRQDRAWCAADGFCPVLSTSRYVSRRHAEIAYDERTAGWVITDVGFDGSGSTHGTLVTPADRGTPPTLLCGDSHVLHHGDLICLYPRRIHDGGYDGSYFSWAVGKRDENYRFEVLA